MKVYDTVQKIFDVGEHASWLAGDFARSDVPQAIGRLVLVSLCLSYHGTVELAKAMLGIRREPDAHQ